MDKEYLDFEDYVKRVFFPKVGEVVFPVLLSSIYSTKFIDRELIDKTRYKIHVLLTWTAGYFKSSIFQLMRRVAPSRLKINTLSRGSAAALSGSFNKGEFYVPDFLISDILIIPEIGLIIGKQAQDIEQQMLIALEDSEVRVGLVKGLELSSKSLAKIHAYGADIKDDRLVYRTKTIVWTSTHTIDGISDLNYQALMSRFLIVNLDLKDIPKDVSVKNPKDMYDDVVENNFRVWLENKYNQKVTLDHSFVQKILEYINVDVDERMNPRFMGDLRRIGLCYKAMFPQMTEDDMYKFLIQFVGLNKPKKSRDIIAWYIYQNPRTMKEIIDYTGLEMHAIYNHLKRLGAMKFKENGSMKYYLDSIEKIKVRRIIKKVGDV